MHPLLRATLLLCPSAFRLEYGDQIIIDAGDGRWQGWRNLFVICASVAWSGLLLHAESLYRNVAYAMRALAHSRLYAAVSILAICVAIGANVAVASVVEGVLLSPLPFPHGERLYSVEAHGPYDGWSYLNAHDYFARSKTVTGFGIAADDRSTILDRGRPRDVNGKQVDEQYFGVLGIPAQLGRLLDARDTGKNVVVISDTLWRSFGADPAIVGQGLNLDGVRYTIAGVAAARFRDPELDRLATNAYWVPDDVPSRRVRMRSDSVGVARLRPGVSVAAAQADLRRIVGDLDRRYPNPAAGKFQSPGTVVPLLTHIAGAVQPMLWLLYAAVNVLLLIACANVANLALVRAAARERELVVRSALGASRASIAAQLCTESSILAVAGGLFGIALGWTGLRTFKTFGSQILPRWETVHIDGTVTFYVVGLVVFTAIVTGLLPVLWLRRDVATALKSAGRSGDQSGSKRLRTGLVVAEIALAIAVVISAGLIVRSLVALTHVELGFDGTHVTLMDNPTLPRKFARTFSGRLDAIDRLLTGFRRIPGVLDVAGSGSAPFTDRWWGVIANIPANATAQHPIQMNAVTRDYFRTLRIPLVAGRAFSESDRLNARPVAIINTMLARRYFGTASPLGRTIFPHMDIGPNTVVPRTIVGVVGDTRHSLSLAARPEVYVALTQFPLVFNFVLRTDGHDAGLAKAVEGVIARLDPTLAPPGLTPYADILRSDALQSQAFTLLFGTFALASLLLALAGIYAVTAYSVERRMQEFGIRKAIGARNGDVLREVIGGTLRYSAAGVVLGLCLAASFTRLLSAMLFQTSPLDAATFGLVIVLVLGCAALAAFVPANRATRITPVEALRYE